MDVTTDRTYQATLAGDADSPAIISVPNAQGPAAADVTVSCVAQQAGSGDPSPQNVREIAGRESVVVLACGKNIANVVSPYQVSSAPPSSIVSVIAHGSIKMSASAAVNATWAAWRMWWVVKPYTYYTISAKMECDDTSFAPRLSIYSKTGRNGTPLSKSELDNNGSITIYSNDNNLIGLYFHFSTDTSSRGARTVRYYDIQIEEGNTATVYESYRDMGGGTINPASPLYGLPGAEDTVMVNTAGNVTVTRRTGCIVLDGTESWIMGIKNSDGYYWRLPVSGILEITSPVIPNIICSNYVTVNPNLQWGNPINSISQNFKPGSRTEILIYDTRYAQSEISEWKSYLAAQKSAGTPVTVVYELAVPTAETPEDIMPITPDSGEMNICTDGDKIEATLNLSGWDTIG